MNSFYVQCDCGWRSKRYSVRGFAYDEGRDHLEYSHWKPDIVMFETTAEPDKDAQ